MQYPSPYGEIPVMSTRPKRQSQLPVHLSDYVVQPVGWRQPEQLPETHAVHPRQGLNEQSTVNSAQSMSSYSSRATSPLSQYAENKTIDEWIATNESPAARSQYDFHPQLYSAGPAGAIATQRFPSPFHRPWEEPVPNRFLQSAPSMVLTHPAANLLATQSVQQSSTPNLRFNRPQQSHSSPPCGLRRETSLEDTPRAYVHSAKSFTQSTHEQEQPLLESLNRMMSELQVIKEQATASYARAPFPQEQLHRNFPPQHPLVTNQQHPVYEPSPDPVLRKTFPNGPQSQWSENDNLPQPPLGFPSANQPYNTVPPQTPQTCSRERTYRGPIPTIPDFTKRDPSEFTRLKIALENLLPLDATELFRYQVLLDHLKFEEALLVADAFLNSVTPYSDTMAALTEKFGQPQKLALKRITTVLAAPDIRHGDSQAFQKFALQVRALVGMLKTLGHDGAVELQCGSHVERLLSKLPSDLRSEFRRQMYRKAGTGYDLTDFSEWLQYEAWCQDSEGSANLKDHKPEGRRKFDQKHNPKSTYLATVLHGAEDSFNQHPSELSSKKPDNVRRKKIRQAYCPYCDSGDHFLSQCDTFKTFDKDQITQWIVTNKRCWRCGRAHQAAQCNLKKPCSKCQGRHLQILHDVNTKPAREGSCLVNSATETLYLDRPTEGSRVLLKVIRVLLRHETKTLDTYAVLDDGSERTMLLPEATHKLGLQGSPEALALRTIRQDVQLLNGAAVTFKISPITQPNRSFTITDAFTAKRLNLADHSYPMATLKSKYKHLQDIPIQPFDKVTPMVLIGADHSHLIVPVEPVRLGPPGGPAAIRTRLGWTLQGPTRVVTQKFSSQQCLFTSLSPLEIELKKNVERLWQLDILPQRSEKQVTRSREDQQAIGLLEAKTTRVEVNGILRYATPLLRKSKFPLFQAPMDAVMSRLRGIEKRLMKDQETSAVYEAEIKKLEEAGAVAKITTQSAASDEESWFIPHHMVQHDGSKKRARWLQARRIFSPTCPSLRIPNRFLREGHCIPPARSGHRCVADGSNLYVFGGYNPDFEEAGGSENEDYPLFRELWRYHFATATWQQVRTEGYMPTELASMSAVIHGNNLLVFGGTGIPFGENNSNDVHVCNVQYRRWNLLNCRGNKPNKIYGQAMVIINGYLYVFGGTTGYLYSTDLHRLDLTTKEWTHLKPNNTPSDLPEERYRHELAHDGQRIYILGGGTSWTSYSLDKIHAYNLETNYWEEMVTKPHEKIGYPASRRCHSCVQVKDEVFVCGGYNGESILSDLWRLNLRTFQWMKLPAVMPEPAYFHCAAVTPAGCMYVHGGVVNISGNRRTASLYKVWLVVPSLLELTWEKLLKMFPHLTQLSTLQLLSLGLTHTLIQRLK